MKVHFFSILFILLSVGLTLVSLNSGFYLYQSLFTFSTAVLICSVFEILRLSTLYSIIKFKGWSRFIVFILYSMLSVVCFFASVISLDSQIIQRNNEYQNVTENEIEKDLFLIKNSYSQKYESQFNEINKKLEEFNQNLARNPKSKYYLERVKQYKEKEEELLLERNTLLNKLSYKNVSRDEIKSHIAILGLTSVNGSYVNQDVSPFQAAASELLGIEVITLQKYIGYSLGFAVEAGILLLAILSFAIKRQKKKDSQKNEELKEISDINNEISQSENINIEENKNNIVFNNLKTINEKDIAVVRDIVSENNRENIKLDDKIGEELKDNEILKSTETTEIKETIVDDDKKFDNKIYENSQKVGDIWIFENNESSEDNNKKSNIKMLEKGENFEIKPKRKVKRLVSSLDYSSK